MKWIALMAAAASLLASYSALGQAPVDFPVLCGDAEKMTNSVFGEKYREVPFAKWDVNEDAGVRGLVTVNHETGTVTVFLIKDGAACMLTSGKNLRVYEKKLPTTRN